MNKLEVSQEDHLRETIAHTHTDLRVALMMLRRWRVMAAWKKLQQGYDRLGKALESPRRQHEEQPMGAALRR